MTTTNPLAKHRYLLPTQNTCASMPCAKTFQFITHFTEQYSYIDGVKMVLAGGCKWIQLRIKEGTSTELEKHARTVQQLCKAHDATFIINDYVWLAQKIGADGVHLGKNDMPICQARKRLGPNALIGATVNNLNDVLNLPLSALPNYVGCGPFRFTHTKQNLAPILGIEGYKNLLAQMQQHGINLPVVAIGGIQSNDISSLLKLGIHSIALSSSILQATHPTQETKKIMNIITNH